MELEVIKAPLIFPRRVDYFKFHCFNDFVSHFDVLSFKAKQFLIQINKNSCNIKLGTVQMRSASSPCKQGGMRVVEMKESDVVKT